MGSSEQVMVFKEMSKSSCFQAVLYYVCGFTKLENPEILEIISSYQHGNPPSALEPNQTIPSDQ